MFGNYVNREDLSKLWHKTTQRDWGRLSRLFRPGAERVAAAWSHTESQPTHWWDVPGMQARWNRLVTGDPELTPRRWLAESFLGDRTNLHGLSVGCGTGARELDWARLGVFGRLDAIDLSEPRIDAARVAAREARLDGVVRFQVGDVLSFARPGSYDVIVAEQSLHHCAPMAKVMRRLARLLVPGGLLLLDEYVGPSRFQWTDAQLAAADELLQSLPDRYRVSAHGGHLREHVVRPSLLSMKLRDPSEAVESADVLPQLERHFEVLVERGYGGNVLHLLFDGIAQNFREPDEQTRALLDGCFSFEDEFLQTNDLPHDFVVLAAKKRA